MAGKALDLRDGTLGMLATGDIFARLISLDHAVGEHILGLPFAITDALEPVFSTISIIGSTW